MSTVLVERGVHGAGVERCPQCWWREVSTVLVERGAHGAGGERCPLCWWREVSTVLVGGGSLIAYRHGLRMAKVWVGWLGG